ncbi:MAG TPA: adhesin [Pseudonocardiaceae bacterium]|jgi:iron-sulfur cluster assembly protein|nr:adhesin [Pseudonocardiaceae bacterium]
MPEGSGLRVEAVSVTEHDEHSLELSMVPQPAAGDTIVQGGAAVVFLEPVAAQALDDMVLDVQRLDSTDGQQAYRFALAPHPFPDVPPA